MNWIPPNLRLFAGTVFRMRYASPGGEEKLRYFILLNATPQTDPLVLLVTPTTRIEKRERFHGANAASALVYLSPDDYAGFTEACVVDCESYVLKEKDALLAVLSRREAVFLDSLPDAALQRIVACFLANRAIPPGHKRLVRPEE